MNEERSYDGMKPCPFCGGTAVIKIGELIGNRSTYVTCTRCHCITNRFAIGFLLASKREVSEEEAIQKAIDKWNQRIPAAAGTQKGAQA